MIKIVTNGRLNINGGKVNFQRYEFNPKLFKKRNKNLVQNFFEINDMKIFVSDDLLKENGGKLKFSDIYREYGLVKKGGELHLTKDKKNTFIIFFTGLDLSMLTTPVYHITNMRNNKPIKSRFHNLTQYSKDKQTVIYQETIFKNPMRNMYFRVRHDRSVGEIYVTYERAYNYLRTTKTIDAKHTDMYFKNRKFN